jgi:hypothetical protein
MRDLKFYYAYENKIQNVAEPQTDTAIKHPFSQQHHLRWVVTLPIVLFFKMSPARSCSGARRRLKGFHIPCGIISSKILQIYYVFHFTS